MTPAEHVAPSPATAAPPEDLGSAPPAERVTPLVMVAGPRELGDDESRVRASIERYFAEAPEPLRVIHGNARGVDKIAGEAAKRHGHTVVACPVIDIDRLAAKQAGRPRKAPLYRTLRMLDLLRPDWVQAWWDGRSSGTGFTLTQAQKRGIATYTLPVRTSTDGAEGAPSGSDTE